MKGKVNCTCKNCGIIFYRHKSRVLWGRGIYCSKRCKVTHAIGKTQNVGLKNGQWKGDMVGYICLHKWVKRHKPRPLYCEHCNTKEPYDLANISGQYKRDINDFKWLCRRCHMEKDGRLQILKGNAIKYETWKNFSNTKPFLGKHHTKETKLKMSLAARGRIFTPEHREHIRLANIGRKHKQETINKIKASSHKKDLPVDQIRELHKQGHSIREIARLFGCGATAIHNRLK